MFLQGLMGYFFKFALAGRLIRWAAGGILGLAFLGWIVEQSGPRDCEVVVHVAEADVVVSVGDRTYPIEGQRDDPIAFNLAPGRHRLVMKRGDRILFEESLEVRPGENVVRTAWDPERVRNRPARSR